ncbi:hypothetical protein ACKWTF_008525 [Chironomus riparius]
MKNLIAVYCLIIAIANKSCECAAIEAQTDERGDNFYRFSYTLDDGTARYEEGILNEVDGVKFYNVNGFYKYRGTDEKVYLVNYTSDPEHGYQATLSVVGEIQPISPVINPELIKSLLG